jgi:hypothetical protein
MKTLRTALCMMMASGTLLHAQTADSQGWSRSVLADRTEYTHQATRATLIVRAVPTLAGRSLSDALVVLTPSVRAACRDIATTPIVVDEGGAVAYRNSVAAPRTCLVLVARGAGALVTVIGVGQPNAPVDLLAAARDVIRPPSARQSSATAPASGSPTMATPTSAATSAATGALASGWPDGGDVPATIADMDWAQTLALGMSPSRDLRPARYECFVSDDARRVSPVADGILTVRADGAYRYQTAGVSADGQWRRTVDNNDKRPTFAFAGPLVARGARVGSDAAGPSIRLTESAPTQRELVCYLAGPASEQARLQMVNSTVMQETISCRFADGMVTPVTFAAGRYSSARGGGVFRDYSLLKGRESWYGGFEFDGGPFENARGFLNVDARGQRVLEIGVTTSTSRGYWYSAQETKPVASCVSTVPVRRIPVYGRQPAPRTNVTGGPAGLYTAQTYQAFNNTVEATVYTFRANGWYSDELPEGRDIDCTRTKPSGEPVCLGYQLSGGKIRMQETAGTWDDAEWEALKVTADGFSVDDRPYHRLASLTGLRLDGVYKTQSGTSSGTIAGALTTIVTEGTYVFTADGTFRAASTVFARTGIGPGVNGDSPIMGSASSTRDQASAGRYRIDGNWLVMTTSDGRVARVFIHLSGQDRVANQSPEFVYIDGSLYARQ